MVENEMQLIQQFDEIENKVECLIGICRSLETANLELRNKVSSLENELKDKTEIITGLTDEKLLVQSKIETILEKLENMAANNLNSLP